MNTPLLENSIEALKLLRTELHSNVEDSVLEMLDKVINDLEALQNHSDKISPNDVLIVLGKVIETLPVIVQLIKILSDGMKQ